MNEEGRGRGWGRSGVYGKEASMTCFRKYNILQAKLLIPYKDSNAYSSAGCRLGKRACWCLHQLSPGVLYISGDRSCTKVFEWMFGSHVSRLVGKFSPQ